MIVFKQDTNRTLALKCMLSEYASDSLSTRYNLEDSRANRTIAVSSVQETSPVKASLNKTKTNQGALFARVPKNRTATSSFGLRYIERYGTGDMIRLRTEADLPEPKFQLTDGFLSIIRRPFRDQASPRLESRLESGLESSRRAQLEAQSAAQSERVVLALADSPLSAGEIALILSLESKSGALKRSIKQLLEDGLIEYTIPDKPSSRLQKYRITDKGRALVESLKNE